MQEKSLIKKNILKFIDYKGISKYKFYQETGITRGILDQNNGMSEENAAKFLAYYSEVSAKWLITGKGSMLTPSELMIEEEMQQHDKEVAEGKWHTGMTSSQGFPLIPVEAMVGYGNGDAQVMDYEIQENYLITPELSGKGIKYLIRVSGSSMTPEYNNGDLLACRPIIDISFIQWGKVYVLDTDQGLLVKRLFPCNPTDEDCLECRSDNYEKYPPFKIRRESIRHIAIVVAVLHLE